MTCGPRTHSSPAAEWPDSGTGISARSSESTSTSLNSVLHTAVPMEFSGEPSPTRRCETGDSSVMP